VLFLHTYLPALGLLDIAAHKAVFPLLLWPSCSPKFITICFVDLFHITSPYSVPLSPLPLVLGNASRIMYATSIQVQHGHNLPHYNPHIQILTNGHVQPSPSHLPLPNGHSHNQPPPPAQSQRSAPPPAPKEPITVVGIPSVSIQNNQLLVGSSQSSQCPHQLTIPVFLMPLLLCQVQRAPIHPSRYWATVHSVQSGCVIGMGPYPPIPHSLPCNVEQEQDQNGRVSGSSPSSV